ncbi:MAG: FMN-binding protein [Erysipelotrichales bacterium]|nr:FMN-binding protein [Erysipelotrichales bacterium]
MKKFIAIAVVAMLTLTACSSGSKGVSGTFTSTARGMSEVKVTVTLEDSVITAVELDCSNETPGFGVEACQKLVEENIIVNANGSEFDNIAGSTITTDAVKKALDAALTESGR